VDLDWSGAPRRFTLGRARELSPELTPWTTDTVWLRTFVSSAAQFAPDHTTTFSISHPQDGGVVTTGTRDWNDYGVASTITFNQQDAAGLVARARGHRRYYAGLLAGGHARIVRRRDDEEVVLAERPHPYAIDDRHRLELRVHGSRLQLLVDAEPCVQADDDAYSSGGAGFVVCRGAILGDGFEVRGIDDARA
jgi:hypothetical protein